MRSANWPQKNKKPSFSFSDWRKRIISFAVATIITLVVWYGGWWIYTVASIWAFLPNYLYGLLLLLGIGICWFKPVKEIYLNVPFVRNLTIQLWSKLPHHNPFKKQETVSNIPKSWITRGKPKSSTGQQYVIVAKPKKKQRFRIPGWLMFKRVLAFSLACFWFFLGQATLLGSTQTMGFYVFFMLTCYLLLDYVWKTRRPPKLFEEVKS